MLSGNRFNVKCIGAKATCFATMHYINCFLLKKAGKMLNLTIDPDNGTINVTIRLAGEEHPFDACIGKYEFNEKTVLLSDIITSKEWINTLLKELRPGGIVLPVSEKTLNILKSIIRG